MIFMVWYERIVKQYKKGKGFQKVINLSIHDEFIHKEAVIVISKDDFNEMADKVANEKVAASEDVNKDDKIASLESIITEKSGRITDLTDQIQSLKDEKADAVDERKKLSAELNDKNEALIKATALLTAYENQSWPDRLLNRKPKLKEAMDIYLADKGTVDANAEVMDEDSKE